MHAYLMCCKPIFPKSLPEARLHLQVYRSTDLGRTPDMSEIGRARDSNTNIIGLVSNTSIHMNTSIRRNMNLNICINTSTNQHTDANMNTHINIGIFVLCILY